MVAKPGGGATRVTVLRRMMPSDANPAGNVFGGTIMKIVDEVAGIVAQRHCRSNVVTARMERMDFHEPVFVGDLLILEGALVYTGKTSMDVRIEIHAENLETGDRVHTGTAWLTLVALSDRGKPSPVPPHVPASEEEKLWWQEAEERRQREKRAGSKR